MYQEKKNSYLSHNGHTYNLNKIFQIVDQYPIQQMNIDFLDWMIPKEINDLDRVLRSDTEYPIIVMPFKHKWLVIDGLHRLIKTKLADKPKIKVKVISEKDLQKTLIK